MLNLFEPSNSLQKLLPQDDHRIVKKNKIYEQRRPGKIGFICEAPSDFIFEGSVSMLIILLVHAINFIQIYNQIVLPLKAIGGKNKPK